MEQQPRTVDEQRPTPSGGGGLRRAGRMLRRIAVTVAGITVVAIGIVLLPLPGPGWVVIFAGLSILGTE